MKVCINFNSDDYAEINRIMYAIDYIHPDKFIRMVVDDWTSNYKTDINNRLLNKLFNPPNEYDYTATKYNEDKKKDSDFIDSIRKNNTQKTEYKYIYKKKNAFHAYSHVGNKNVYIGRYFDIEDAYKAQQEFEENYIYDNKKVI